MIALVGFATQSKSAPIINTVMIIIIIIINIF